MGTVIALNKSVQENNEQDAFCGLQKCPQFERDCEKHEKTMKLLKNFPAIKQSWLNSCVL